MRGFGWLVPLVILFFVIGAVAWWSTDDETHPSSSVKIERPSRLQQAPISMKARKGLSVRTKPSETKAREPIQKKIRQTTRKSHPAFAGHRRGDPEVQKLSRFCKSLLAAARAEPDNPRRLVDFAYAVDSEGHPELALDALRKALALGTDFEGREMVLHLVEEYDEAVRNNKAKPVPIGVLDRLSP